MRAKIREVPDFGKTITFEFGIRHAFSDDMVLDLALYNKDNLANPSARLVTLFDPNLQGNQLFQLIENVDFGNARGLDLRLDRRHGRRPPAPAPPGPRTLRRG